MKWIFPFCFRFILCPLFPFSQAQSKGGILAKTVEYITELKMINTRMAEQLKDNENINLDIEILRQQVGVFSHL